MSKKTIALITSALISASTLAYAQDAGTPTPAPTDAPKVEQPEMDKKEMRREKRDERREMRDERREMKKEMRREKRDERRSTHGAGANTGS